MHHVDRFRQLLHAVLIASLIRMPLLEPVVLVPRVVPIRCTVIIVPRIVPIGTAVVVIPSSTPTIPTATAIVVPAILIVVVVSIVRSVPIVPCPVAAPFVVPITTPVAWIPIVPRNVIIVVSMAHTYATTSFVPFAQRDQGQEGALNSAAAFLARRVNVMLFSEGQISAVICSPSPIKTDRITLTSTCLHRSQTNRTIFHDFHRQLGGIFTKHIFPRFACTAP